MGDIHWVARGTGAPKDRDEVNRRKVCECDGCVCVLEVMGAPSRLTFTRKAALARMFPILDLSWEENTARRQPEAGHEEKKRSKKRPGANQPAQNHLPMVGDL